MKTLKSHLSIFILLFIGAGSLYAQEYDDMYFSSKDRKKVKKVSDKKSFTQDLSDVQQFQQMAEESYSARNVNPEYIAKYQAASRENATTEFSDNEYFVEDYRAQNAAEVTDNFVGASNVAVRDRFGNVTYFNDYSDVFWSDPFLYQGTIYDPLYRPFLRSAFYSPFGFRNGWTLSLGFGFGAGWFGHSAIGFGTGFGFWDPFWCPPGFYGFGWNRWNRWGSPYWGGNNVVVINNYENRSNRIYRRGAASSRSSGVINSRRNAIVDNNDGRSSSGRYAVSNTDRRNYDDAQSRYYRRSRSAVNSSEGVSSRSSSASRSAATNYNPNSRSYNSSSRSSVTRSSDYNRSSNYNRSGRSYNNSRGSSYNRSTTPRGNSNYSRPSNSRSSGYSPSRSSGRSSYSTPSRSSGRSSGVSSGSRSSSRSSGTRSSGSRSSGSSRRGNN